MSTPRTKLADGDEVVGSAEAASLYLDEVFGIEVAPQTIKVRASQGKGPARRLIGDKKVYTRRGLDEYGAVVKDRLDNKPWKLKRDERAKARGAAARRLAQARA